MIGGGTSWSKPGDGVGSGSGSVIARPLERFVVGEIGWPGSFRRRLFDGGGSTSLGTQAVCVPVCQVPPPLTHSSSHRNSPLRSLLSRAGGQCATVPARRRSRRGRGNCFLRCGVWGEFARQNRSFGELAPSTQVLAASAPAPAPAGRRSCRVRREHARPPRGPVNLPRTPAARSGPPRRAGTARPRRRGPEPPGGTTQGRPVLPPPAARPRCPHPEGRRTPYRGCSSPTLLTQRNRLVVFLSPLTSFRATPRLGDRGSD